MILDSVQQLEGFLAETASSRSIFLYPILKDARLHRHNNPIIGFVLVDTQTRKTYTISNGHPEGIFHTSDLSFLKEYAVYCYDTAAFRYAGYDVSEYVDVLMQYYLYTNQGYSSDIPNIVSHYSRIYQNCYKINELVSLYKHEEIALEVFAMSWVRDTQPGLQFYQHHLVDVFHTIEKSGLKIDVPGFDARFSKTFSKDGDLCYTQYNYYTTTGRPSNRFGGINFAALNKEDDTRDVFISRFTDGFLLELDFNSYHPRLIAQLIDYDFGDDNVYEHLAAYYANTSTPTAEQIESAKEATFRQLYGGIQQQYLHIPFFAKTNDLAKYLWNKAMNDGYIESPISGRRLVILNYQDINVYTLFNYFIQMYETESNVLVLTTIHELLKNKETKPVLYTYDSVLFDVKPDELTYLLEAVIPNSINLQKFPIKIKQGKTYKTLQVRDNSAYLLKSTV